MKRVLSTLAVLVAIPMALSAFCPTCQKGNASNRGYDYSYGSRSQQTNANPYSLNPAFSPNGQDQFVTQDDQRIARDIRQHIEKNKAAQASNIQTMVEYGKVTFRGRVDSNGTKMQIEEIALEIPGVYNVVNRLEVDEQMLPSNTPSGNQLNYKSTNRFGRGVIAGDYDAAPAEKFQSGSMQKYDNGAMHKQAGIANGALMNDHDLELKVQEKLTTGWFGRKFKDIDYSISNGIVTLEGEVATETDKRTAERLVREIVEVKNVNNNLDVANGSK